MRSLVSKLILGAVLLFIVVALSSSTTYVVEPGTRGVKVTLGKASDNFLPQGFGWKTPFVTTIVPVNVRQKTSAVRADCFSSDLQQIVADLRVLYRVPEKSVVQIYRQYAGDPFDSLIAPRVQEAVKEVTALQTAEQIVKNREQIKTKALELARNKVGTLLVIEDIVIQNISLTRELENAIEAKMVQEQEAAKSKYLQQRAQIDADTAVIQAKGEAEAIRIRGEALKDNPMFVDLKIVDKWDGLTPVVIGGNNLVYQLQDLQQLKANATTTPQSAPVQRRATR